MNWKSDLLCINSRSGHTSASDVGLAWHGALWDNSICAMLHRLWSFNPIMSTAARPSRDLEIEYPDSDGKPIAESTLQFRWIVTIKEGAEALFRRDPDVFVAGDPFWYPVEGNNKIRTAPDTLIVFG